MTNGKLEVHLNEITYTHTILCK